MSSVSIRAPKRKPVQPRPPAATKTTPNVKKEPIEIPVDNRKWTSYTLTAGDNSANGTRYNVMRFQTSKSQDPMSSMTRPIKFARRDLHEIPHVDAVALPETATLPPSTVAPAKPEYSVAPHAGQTLQRKQFRKRTHEVFQQDEQVRQLRQEEKFPWIIEDSEGQQTFQGSLEGGQGGSYVFLTLTTDGFDVTPLSKFYRFGQRQKYQTMSLDEAEEKMKKHKSLPRWVMKESDDGNGPSAPSAEPQRQYRMKTTSHNQRSNVKAEEQEEELDFNEDFADDEEQHALVEDEEDNKDLEERIKKEMLSANAIGEADAEAENEADQAAKAKLDKEGRRVQRFLEKVEKNNMYESDSDSNPYESSSSSSEEDEKDTKTTTSVTNKGEDDDNKKTQEKTRADKIRESVNRLQNVSHTTYNTPNTSSLISRASSNSNLSAMKTDSRQARSRPHLVTLKLSKAVLARFPGIPTSAHVDDKKRSLGPDGYDSDRSQKKARVHVHARSPIVSRATSPMQGITASASGSRSASPDPDRDLITVAELRSIVTGAEPQGLSMKDLLRELRPKLARDPRNKQALGTLLKESGIGVNGGKLTLRQ